MIDSPLRVSSELQFIFYVIKKCLNTKFKGDIDKVQLHEKRLNPFKWVDKHIVHM